MAQKTCETFGPTSLGRPLPRHQPPHGPSCLKQRLIIITPARAAVPPRYFGAVLGVASETWSAQLDRHLPDAVRRLLLDHTSICPDEIDGLCLTNSPLSTLRLRLRTRPQDAGTSTAQSCWLQFCPSCLGEDEVPYFRRSWTLATRVSCFRHRCRLRDRCPSCGQGIAPFRQARLVPQQNCAFCGTPLAKPTGQANTGARRLERLIDDVLRLDSAGRAQDDRKHLAARLSRYSLPVGPGTSKLPICRSGFATIFSGGFRKGQAELLASKAMAHRSCGSNLLMPLEITMGWSMH
jgi:hypothetical protein